MIGNRGLVLGKFYPPHLGHHYLIEEAKKKCEKLTVLVAGSIQESIPLDLRAHWIQVRHPDVEVCQVYDEIPDNYNDTKVWEEHIDLFSSALLYMPDVVMASERYVYELAARMKAWPELLDPQRAIYPISSTNIRDNPPSCWQYLQPEVKGYLGKRIVVVGAESTGTTTLAFDLSEAYGGMTVPEYGREYTERVGPDHQWKPRDFAFIAATQSAREQAYVESSQQWITVCDTNALATSVFEELYLDSANIVTDHLASQDRPDLYILTSPNGVEWEDDGTRDPRLKDKRQWMHERFRERLIETAIPWMEVNGPPAIRLAQAKEAIRENTYWRFAEPLTEEVKP